MLTRKTSCSFHIPWELQCSSHQEPEMNQICPNSNSPNLFWIIWFPPGHWTCSGLLLSAPLQSPCPSLVEQLVAAAADEKIGLSFLDNSKLSSILIWNLLLGQLLLGGLPLLDAVWNVDRDWLGAKVSATDVARNWHLPLLHYLSLWIRIRNQLCLLLVLSRLTEECLDQWRSAGGVSR